MERIQPIPGRPPAIQPVPALRRTERTQEKRRRDEEEQRRRRRPDDDAHDEQPPDDGRPHVDVRV